MPSEQETYRKGIKDQLDRIEAQTIKTNGRVSGLEGWQFYVIGFCASVGMLLVPVVISVAQKTLA